MPVNETVTITYVSATGVYNFDFATSGDTTVLSDGATFTATTGNANHYIASSKYGRQQVMFDLTQATPSSIAAIEALEGTHHIEASSATSTIDDTATRAAIVASNNCDVTAAGVNVAIIASKTADITAAATECAIIASDGGDITGAASSSAIIGSKGTISSTGANNIIAGTGGSSTISGTAAQSVLLAGQGATISASNVVLANCTTNGTNAATASTAGQFYCRSDSGESHYVNVDANDTDFYLVDSTGFALKGATGLLSYQPVAVSVIGDTQTVTLSSSVMVATPDANRIGGVLATAGATSGQVAHIVNDSGSFSWTVSTNIKPSTAIAASTAITVVFYGSDWYVV